MLLVLLLSGKGEFDFSSMTAELTVVGVGVLLGVGLGGSGVVDTVMTPLLGGLSTVGTDNGVTVKSDTTTSGLGAGGILVLLKVFTTVVIVVAALAIKGDGSDTRAN